MFTAKRFSFPWFLNWLVFGVCVYLSGTFAIQLYTGLVDLAEDKTLLGIGAAVVEGLKILTLIVANTALFGATRIKTQNLEAHRKGHFKQAFWKVAEDIEFVALASRYSKLVQTYVRMFFLYGFFAIITISGSFGFVLTHVAMRNQEHVIVANTETVDTQTDQIKTNRDTIEQNKKTIDRNNLDIDTLNGKLRKLEADATLTEEDRAKKEAPLQSKVDGLTATNTKLAQVNTGLASTNTGLSKTNVTLKVQDKTAENSVKKDMYDLMSDAFGHAVSADSIRATLLSLFAIAIELGLFFFSPHFRSFEETLTSVVAGSKEGEFTWKAAPKVEAPVAPVVEEQVVKPAHERPLVEQKIAFTPTPVAVEPSWEEQPLSFMVDEVEEVGVVGPEVEPLADPETALPVEPEAVVESEVALSPEVTPDEISKFLDQLFGTGPELVTVETAAKRSDIALPLARKVFDFLFTHKRDGKVLVGFNTGNGSFYPRFALPVLKEEVHNHFVVPTPQVS